MKASIRIYRALAVGAGSLSLIAGCGSSSSSAGTTTTTAPAATTTEAAPTTLAPTTLPAPTTTLPAPIAFTLRSDGLGPFDFGTPSGVVIDAMTTEFGAPESFEPMEFIVDVDNPTGPYIFPSEGEGFYFAYPQFGESCWFGNTLCTTFGGESQDALAFTGWTYSTDTTGTFKTAGGISVGTRWSDAFELTDVGGFCEVGDATLNGMYVLVLSEGTRFDEGTPAPEDVVITYMEAGELTLYSQELC